MGEKIGIKWLFENVFKITESIKFEINSAQEFDETRQFLQELF